MRIRFTQIDGRLPNLALMRLAAYHRARGDEIVFNPSLTRDITEGHYDRVYGSAVFSTSKQRINTFCFHWPDAILGGSGTGNTVTVEDIVGGSWEHADYSAYPEYDASLGYSTRGCRLHCPFCHVWKTEGKVKSVNTINELWRGPGHTRKISLLDNDFFGQPVKQWMARVDEIVNGNFRICLSQGINLRKLNADEAAALATLQYRDISFRERRIYTALDDITHARAFFRGVDRLAAVGIPPKHLMVFMLIGFKDEPMDRILERFDAIANAGALPYPMVYQTSATPRDERLWALRQFQRWAVTGLYRAVPWTDYIPNYRRPRAA